jgi:hypothetical protein
MTSSSPRSPRPSAVGPEAGHAAESPAPSDATVPPSLDGSREARRLAAAVLEVLAGVRSPSDAARVLGLSLARYYQLEQRALAGLVTAFTRDGVSLRIPRDPWADAVYDGEPLDVIRRALTLLLRSC